MLKKLAEELKDQRLKQNITLQQISSKTRIDMKFLEAIENGNFDVLPDVYLKAFIKSYASAVGLDEDTTLKKYEVAKAGKEADSKEIEEIIHHNEERKTPHKKEFVVVDANLNSPADEETSGGLPKNTLILIGAAIALLIILIIAYLLIFKESSDEISVEQPNQEIVNSDQPRFEEEVTPATVDSAALRDSLQNANLSPDSLTLAIKTIDAAAWIRVAYDDNPKEQDFNIGSNSQKIVRAKSKFKLLIGNASNVQLFLNNQPLELKAKAGETKSVKIDTSGVQYLKIGKPLITNEQ